MKFGSWWSALKISWKWYICLFTPINSSNCLHSPNLRIFSLWKHWNVRNVNPFMKMSFKTHSVEITLRFSLTHFWQKSRESNGFTKEITKELIWQNCFHWERNFRFYTWFEFTEKFLLLPMSGFEAPESIFSCNFSSINSWAMVSRIFFVGIWLDYEHRLTSKYSTQSGSRTLTNHT